MTYISQESLDYILNKYHDTQKPFDPLKRFVRNDAIFDASTGSSPQQITEAVLAQDATLEGLPHPVRKAKALGLILENTRIRCDSRDIFPAINTIDRPLFTTLIKKWKAEAMAQIPEAEAQRVRLETDGIANISLDFSHSVPNWERLLTLGFPGVLAQSEQARRSRPLTEEEDAFFEGIRLTYGAVLAFLGRLEALARETPGSEKMAQALGNLQFSAPKSFYEALLTAYVYFMVSEHVDFLQVRSLSHFDRLFGVFFRQDLSAGVPEQTLRQQLAYFFLQFTAIGNYWNQPVYLGGEKADGATQINELSYVFLDVYDQMNIYSPKIQLKVSESTPKDFVCKALDMIRRGRNSIVFVSDTTIRKALVRAGVSPEDARLCDIKGCYEYAPPESYCSEMNYINLLKPLEYTLHRGCDGVTGAFSGNISPDLAAYDTFEALYTEYKRQLLWVADQVIDTVNALEQKLPQISPLSLLSGTFQSCLDTGRDAIGGGSRRNSTVLSVGFLADAADSLAMLQKYVYEQKALTLEALVKALDENFEHDRALRQRLSLDPEKYGNNQPRPDAIAADLVSFLAENISGRPNAPIRGGQWEVGFHVARMSYTQGQKTAATPNGRPFGQELSKNASPSMGANRGGATAAILSVTKLDATAFVGDASLDLGLLPASVRGEEGLEAMWGLLMTFLRRGGHAIHINVFDADTLRDAQAHPENYRDLQIRVCGWNVLWNNISPEEQAGFIRQAESLI